MKRLGFSALCVVLLISCARREPPVPVKDTLYRHLSGDPATLDPTTISEEQGLQVVEMIFRPLIGVDAARKFVPGLAREWTVSPDGLVYEFRLDPDARWEDGSPVTSDDVAFTVERIRDPKVAAQTWRSGFENLAAIEMPERSVVRFRFERPYSERLFAFTVPIVSRAAFSRAPAEASRKPVGSGPYRLASWEANQKIVLHRRTDSAGEPAHFREVVFRVIPDRTVWLQAGIRGDLDEFRVTRDQRASAAASADFNARHDLHRVPQPTQALVIWNCRHPALSDPRVRRALALSWNRAESAKRLYQPEGARLLSGPFLPGLEENAPDVVAPVQNVAESRRLLDEAGLRPGSDGVRRRGGRRVSIELIYHAGQAIYTAIVEILTQSYRDVGIELVARPLDWAAYAERGAAGEFEALLTGRTFIAGNFDPYPHYHSSQAPPRGENAGSYSNPEVDQLLEATHRELDRGRRLDLYRQVHRILARDQPADFLWNADQYWGISKRVEGVTISPMGLFHFLPGPIGWRPAIHEAKAAASPRAGQS